MTAQDRHIRLKLLTLVLCSAAYADLCRRAGDSWIFLRLYTTANNMAPYLLPTDSWDARMVNVIKNIPEAVAPLANRLASLLCLLMRFKELQSNVNSRPGCLLSSVGGLSGVLISINSEVVTALPGQVNHLLKSLEHLLNQSEQGDITDNCWDQLDVALGCLFRFASLGLTSVGRNKQQQEEELERLAFVHWRWLCKAMAPLLHALGWTEISDMMKQYQRRFDGLGLDRQSCTRLRACLTSLSFPRPRQNVEDIKISADLEELDKWTSMQGGTRIEFILQHGQELEAVIRDIAAGSKNLQEACCLLLRRKRSFEPIKKCSAKSFFSLQLNALRARLSELTKNEDLVSKDVFLPVNLKLLCLDRNSSSVEANARKILHWYHNPSFDIIRYMEHNPVSGQLNWNHPTTSVTSSASLCEIHETLLQSSGNLPLVSCEDKRSQLADAVKLMKGFQSQPDQMNQAWNSMTQELEGLLKGMIMIVGGNPQSSIQSSLTCLLAESTTDSNLTPILTKLEQIFVLDTKRDHSICMQLEVSLNLLKFHLFASLGAIDPAEKAALKFRHTLDQLAEIETRLRVMDTFTVSVGTRHPHRALLAARQERLLAKQVRQQSKMAERGGYSFASLSNAIRHFRTGLGAVSTVVELLERLDQLCVHSELGSALDEASVWCLSAHKFATSLLELHSPAFPDLVVPVVEPVARLVFAFADLANHVREAYARSKYPDLDTVLITLASPVSTKLLSDRLRFLLRPDLPTLVGPQHDIPLLRSAAVAMKKSLLYCHLLRVEGNLVSELVLRLIASWRHELQLKQEKKEEEEAAFKTQTMCEDKDEEAEMEEEYSRLFPSFREAFADLIQSDILEDDKVCEHKDKKSSSTFSEQRLNQLKQLASFILEYLTADKAEGFAAMNQVDFQQRFAMVNRLAAMLPGVASSGLEAALVPSFTAVSNLIISRHSQNQTQGSSASSYNFYLDPNVEETQLVRPLLTVVGRAVDQLLEQFPENPVLEQILVVRDRILLLPITSPLAKCLTGLEFLLAACQEWEKNAHRGVSLQTVMDAASNLILRWRRLELANWRSLLLGGSGLAGLRREAAESYWLHVAAVVLEAKKKAETVQALVRFVEAASLADFQTRLDILASAQRMLQLMSAGVPTRRWVGACLANLHSYYSRFKPAVDAAVNGHLKASEKLVTEFVRMTRWKDTNFWSVKTMVDKTRKTMHKTLKQFVKAVSTPCTPSLVDAGDPEESATGLKSSSAELVIATTAAVAPKAPRHIQTIYNVQMKPVGSFVRLSRKAFTLSQTIGQQMSSLSLLEDIADLVPSIATELETLASLKVDETKSKEQRKSQAGHIQQRKRRALNDLFKALQGLGLSYRYGLMTSSNSLANRDGNQLVKPICFHSLI
jgi:hypothetical protein